MSTSWSITPSELDIATGYGSWSTSSATSPARGAPEASSTQRPSRWKRQSSSPTSSPDEGAVAVPSGCRLVRFSPDWTRVSVSIRRGATLDGEPAAGLASASLASARPPRPLATKNHATKSARAPTTIHRRPRRPTTPPHRSDASGVIAGPSSRPGVLCEDPGGVYRRRARAGPNARYDSRSLGKPPERSKTAEAYFRSPRDLSSPHARYASRSWEYSLGSARKETLMSTSSPY